MVGRPKAPASLVCRGGGRIADRLPRPCGQPPDDRLLLSADARMGTSARCILHGLAARSDEPVAGPFRPVTGSGGASLRRGGERTGLAADAARSGHRTPPPPCAAGQCCRQHAVAPPAGGDRQCLLRPLSLAQSASGICALSMAGDAADLADGSCGRLFGPAGVRIAAPCRASSARASDAGFTQGAGRVLHCRVGALPRHWCRWRFRETGTGQRCPARCPAGLPGCTAPAGRTHAAGRGACSIHPVRRQPCPPICSRTGGTRGRRGNADPGRLFLPAGRDQLQLCIQRGFGLRRALHSSGRPGAPAGYSRGDNRESVGPRAVRPFGFSSLRSRFKGRMAPPRGSAGPAAGQPACSNANRDHRQRADRCFCGPRDGWRVHAVPGLRQRALPAAFAARRCGRVPDQPPAFALRRNAPGRQILRSARGAVRAAGLRHRAARQSALL